jgi:sugar diacid utilization regulator
MTAKQKRTSIALREWTSNTFNTEKIDKAADQFSIDPNIIRLFLILPVDKRQSYLDCFKTALETKQFEFDTIDVDSLELLLSVWLTKIVLTHCQSPLVTYSH